MNQSTTGFDKHSIEVKLIGSFDGPIPGGTLLVESDADYVHAAGCIRNAVAAHSPLRVWVRKRPHYSWLQNYSSLTECQCDFGEMTPRLILSESWRVSIPYWLTDQMVHDNTLLELKLPESHPDQFVDAFLSLILGSQFVNTSLSVEIIPDLISIAEQEKYLLFKKYRLLGRCLEEKCSQWTAGSAPAWAGIFCDLLLNKPKELWHDLSLYVLLGNYPEKLLDYEVIPSRTIILRKLPPDKLSNMKFDPVAIEKASSQIDIFYSDVGKEVQSSADLKKLINCCSGNLLPEFKRISQLLGKISIQVDEELIEAVRTKFKSCPGVGTSELFNLDKFIIPARPTALAEGATWDAAKWAAWTIDEYVSYRHWQTSNGDIDSTVEEMVTCFSDWYIKNYVSVHQDLQLSLAHVLTAWKERVSKDALSLILIVDCLPLTFYPLLQKALLLSGFHKHEQGIRFAPLPSNTDVSKTLLISGDWHTDKNEDYATTSAIRVATEWPGKKSIYLPNVHALTEITSPEEGSVLFLNYTPSDQVMHGDPQLKGMTHEEELFRCFEKLAESLHAFYLRWTAGDQDGFSVYVVTDHGATRILEDEKKSFESSVVRNLFANEKYRCAYVEKEILDSIPANLWDFGYRFKQQFGTDERIYFIPRGHRTVGSGQGTRGYTHGGASPEEIIVPVAVFKPLESKWQEPNARFVNLRIDQDSKKAVYHIQRMVSVEIVVQNANPEPLQLMRVEIVTPDNSEVKDFKSHVIAANSENQIEVICYFNKSSLGQKELQFCFIYRYGEEERELILSLEADFKSAMTGGFSLRNL